MTCEWSDSPCASVRLSRLDSFAPSGTDLTLLRITSHVAPYRCFSFFSCQYLRIFKPLTVSPVKAFFHSFARWMHSLKMPATHARIQHLQVSRVRNSIIQLHRQEFVVAPFSQRLVRQFRQHPFQPHFTDKLSTLVGVRFGQDRCRINLLAGVKTCSVSCGCRVERKFPTRPDTRLP